MWYRILRSDAKDMEWRNRTGKGGDSTTGAKGLSENPVADELYSSIFLQMGDVETAIRVHAVLRVQFVGEGLVVRQQFADFANAASHLDFERIHVVDAQAAAPPIRRQFGAARSTIACHSSRKLSRLNELSQSM